MIFNLLQVVVSSTSVVLLHGVSRWDNPPTPAAVLPLVIAHTGAPSLSSSLSPIFFVVSPQLSLRSRRCHCLFHSPGPFYTEESIATPLNFQSPVSQPFLCVPAFSFSFNWLFLLFFAGNVLFEPPWVVSNELLCICQSCNCPFPILHPNGFHLRSLPCIMIAKTCSVDVALSV